MTDGSNNINGDSAIPTTAVFDTSFPLFEAYDGSLGDGDGDDGSGDLTVAEIHEDAAGSDTDNLNDEYVVFENAGSGDLDLTGWYVQDEVEKTYTFPNGFTLGSGEQVTLHTGTGTDTQTDLYWGRPAPPSGTTAAIRCSYTTTATTCTPASRTEANNRGSSRFVFISYLLSVGVLWSVARRER
ncbi:lamin tail domain-containing protein [Haladaptatus pallidirubidus]|uniref:lamin tail domain-containing protein n=1 Tax=Haladaptatus pallidirubidus TaxID=1008152 RepID=UPI0035EFA5F9